MIILATLSFHSAYLQVQHYILVVQAQDNGQPSLSTTITVYCNVLDLNDNAPVFDVRQQQHFYQLQVKTHA